MQVHPGEELRADDRYIKENSVTGVARILDKPWRTDDCHLCPTKAEHLAGFGTDPRPFDVDVVVDDGSVDAVRYRGDEQRRGDCRDGRFEPSTHGVLSIIRPVLEWTIGPAETHPRTGS